MSAALAIINIPRPNIARPAPANDNMPLEYNVPLRYNCPAENCHLHLVTPVDNTKDYGSANALDQYISVDLGDGARVQGQSGGASRDMEYWYDAKGWRSHSLDHVAGSEVFHQHFGQMPPKRTSSRVNPLTAEVGDYTVVRAGGQIGVGKALTYTPTFRIVLGAGVDERIAYHDVDGDDLTLYMVNHQGSTVSMVKSSTDPAVNGTRLNYATGGRYIYDPYGNDAKGASPSGQPYRYTGRRLDAQTGLYYYRARYYDPKIGKFLQTDPIGTDGGMNIYNYVNNDPVNNTDPTGMMPQGQSSPCGISCDAPNGPTPSERGVPGSGPIGGGGGGGSDGTTAISNDGGCFSCMGMESNPKTQRMATAKKAIAIVREIGGLPLDQKINYVDSYASLHPILGVILTNKIDDTLGGNATPIDGVTFKSLGSSNIYRSAVEPRSTWTYRSVDRYGNFGFTTTRGGLTGLESAIFVTGHEALGHVKFGFGTNTLGESRSDMLGASVVFKWRNR